MAETKKIHTNVYLDPKVFRALTNRAKQTGQTFSWEVENILATALGVRNWPKPPKGMKRAKELIKK